MERIAQDDQEQNGRTRANQMLSLVTKARKNRGKKRTMTSFAERRTKVLVRANTTDLTLFGTSEECELHIPMTDSEKPGLLATCLYYCETGDDNLTKCAFYSSCLLMFFPNIQQELEKALDHIGGNVIVVTDPEARNLGLLAGYSKNVNLVFMGQLVLLLFKNITKEGFRQFFTNQTNALKAHAAVLPTEKITMPLSLQTAEVIKGLLGTQQNVRVAVLGEILDRADEDTPIGKVCDYLSSILAWTEMGPVCFIHDALLVTKSPVIYDPAVAKEMVHVIRAYMKLRDFEMPQYFKILATSQESRLISRSLFPILIAVSQSIKKLQEPSTEQFVAQGNVCVETVERLVAMHGEYMLAPTGTAFDNSLKYLQTFDQIEDERDD